MFKQITVAAGALTLANAANLYLGCLSSDVTSLTNNFNSVASQYEAAGYKCTAVNISVIGQVNLGVSTCTIESTVEEVVDDVVGELNQLLAKAGVEDLTNLLTDVVGDVESLLTSVGCIALPFGL